MGNARKSSSENWSNHVYATGFHGKICAKCDQVKEVSLFYKKPTSDGLSSSCMECHKSYMQSRYIKATPKHRPRKPIDTKRRDYRLKVRYGITIDEYESIRLSQNYGCSICGSVEMLYVDHDHTDNRIRGLLCMKCNAGLGMFKDSQKNLENAVLYLKNNANG